MIVTVLLVAMMGRAGEVGAQVATSEPARADSARAVVPGRALLRSALIPGWGQAYVGHPFKAGLLLAGGIYTVGRTVRADGKVTDLADRRPLVTHQAERDLLESDIEYWRAERRRWILWAAAVWVYAMLDAYVDAQLYDFDRVEPDFGPRPSPRGSGSRPLIYLGLAISLEKRKR